MGKIVYGVDIGGTTVKMGVFEIDGTLIDKWEIPTRKEENGRHILPDVAASIQKHISDKGYNKEQVAGVGVGVPGPVDFSGNVYKAVNLGWGNFNVANTLAALTGFSVKAGNDANIAALGEMWKGGGQGFVNMVMVTLGTGVGGGIIVDGRLVSGAKGSGGEIGHMNVNEHEVLACNCGGQGCLEQYASATGIVRLAKNRLAKDDKASVLRDVEISAKGIWDAVKAKDAVAIEIAEEFGYYLGKGLAQIASITNPEAFVVGGGVSKAGEIIFEYVRPSFEKLAFVGSKDAKFVLAELGNDAGIYGAARLVVGEK